MPQRLVVSTDGERISGWGRCVLWRAARPVRPAGAGRRLAGGGAAKISRWCRSVEIAPGEGAVNGQGTGNDRGSAAGNARVRPGEQSTFELTEALKHGFSTPNTG